MRACLMHMDVSSILKNGLVTPFRAVMGKMDIEAMVIMSLTGLFVG